MKKRLLAFCLMLSLVFTLIPAEALATEPENQGSFRVDYDDWNWHNQNGDPEAMVEVEGKTFIDYASTFTVGETLNFTLNPPADRKNANAVPVVEIEVFVGEEGTHPLYRSDSTEGNKITLTNNSDGSYSFSFTPTSTDEFVVRVWWSAYDAFVPGENEFILQANVRNNGSISVTWEEQVAPLETMLEPENGPNIKYCFANADANTISLTFTPGENAFLDTVRVGDIQYITGNDPTGDQKQILSAESGFTQDPETGLYSYHVSAAPEDGFLFIEAEFREEEGGNQGGTYTIDFSDGNISGNTITYRVGESDVTLTLPGNVTIDTNKKATVSDTTVFTLDGFDADKMEVFVYVDDPNDDFNTTLNVTKNETNATTSLSQKSNNGGIPSSIKLKIQGKNTGGDQGEQDQPPQPDRSQDYNDARKDIEDHEYAYYVVTTNQDAANTIKNYLKTELWYEFFGDGTQGDAPVRPYKGMLDKTGLASAITLGGLSSSADPATGCFYYPYEVKLNDETEPVKAEGKVYVLTSPKFFVVKTGNAYHVVDTTDSNDIYIQGDGEVKIFGNGTCAVGRLDTESSHTQAFHITQEHSGLGDDTAIGGLGCTLIVSDGSFQGLKIDGDRNAAPWDFVNTGIYDTGTEAAPAEANVYYGSSSVTLSAIQFDNHTSDRIITNVSLDTTKLPAGAVTITSVSGGYNVAFQTGYDRIPLVITFSEGEPAYVTLNRVGLSMGADRINAGEFDIWHGSDHQVRYRVTETANGYAVYASFFYTGNSEPQESDRVNLFTTITTNTGVTRKVITSSITSSGTMVGGGTIGKANQGSDRYYDDFQLWSGTAAEYAALEKIEAIVFLPGSSADAFGGVKVGSGTGVTWVKSVAE